MRKQNEKNRNDPLPSASDLSVGGVQNGKNKRG